MRLMHINMQVGVGLPHCQSVRSVRGTIWQRVIFDPKTLRETTNSFEGTVLPMVVPKFSLIGLVVMSEYVLICRGRKTRRIRK
jgi:hypothetical protein